MIRWFAQCATKMTVTKNVEDNWLVIDKKNLTHSFTLFTIIIININIR